VPASACSLDLHSPRGTRLCRRQRAAPLDDRWARIRRCRASPSHISPESWNRLCAFVPNIADHLDREFWFKTPDTQTIHRAPVPLYLEQPRCVFVCQKKNVMLDTGKDAENLFYEDTMHPAMGEAQSALQGTIEDTVSLVETHLKAIEQ